VKTSVHEFTGERVIPGQVDDELWDEHIARYAFARQFSADSRVLDIGCGTGYGIAEISSNATLAIGIDPAEGAIDRARPGTAHFVRASAAALPFPAESFDLVTAFEVIEHLPDWPKLIEEARRVLRRDGLFIVSTPNQRYYAESRAAIGPNPFHVREFEHDEFRHALAGAFPFTSIYLQNRVEGFAFSPGDAVLETNLVSAGNPEDAQFFVAVCGFHPIEHRSGFLHLGTASNLLREREQHIHKLEDELALTKRWLSSTIAERDELLTRHSELQTHLEEQNRWGLHLDSLWKAAQERIARLQDEFQAEQKGALEMAAAYGRALADAREDSRAKAQWALETETRLTEALRAKAEELAEAVRLLDRAEATVTERTLWAQGLQQRVEELEQQLRMIRESRWLRMGRVFGLGPQVGGR
jgi:SAM-dependent methyltransferase